MRDFLRSAAFIGRKDVAYSLRRRETIVWVFVMPIVFFYFLGTVTGGSGLGGSAPEALALAAPADAGFLAGQIRKRLEQQGFSVLDASDPASRELPRKLILPPQFTERVLAGQRSKVTFVRSGDGLSADYDSFRVSRAVYTVLADLAVARQSGETPSQAAFERLAAMPRALTLEVRAAGRRHRTPSGFEQTIPGTMVMFTMMVLLTSGAIPLLVERQQGVLRRLASAPMSRGAVVLGKWLGKMALALVQIGFAMLAGRVLFGMHWGRALVAVLLVLGAWAALNASASLLLGSLARTGAQAAAVGVVASLTLAALGGCWWPIEVAPGWMQHLALFLPSGWTMGALHRLVSFGDPGSSVLPHVAGLAVAAAITGWATARVFRFE